MSRIAPLLPPRPPRRHRHAGRLSVSDRAALAGIAYVLRKGVAWRDVPAQLGSVCRRTRLRVQPGTNEGAHPVCRGSPIWTPPGGTIACWKRHHGSVISSPIDCSWADATTRAAAAASCTATPTDL
ncbi:transposase [Streptomyces rishiriensis]|uniref:transposase n=1 Tax=Streptomyces rishiriensis TaxID=68264 RepID=UPI0037A474C2